MASINEQEASLVIQASLISRDIKSLQQPSAEHTDENQIAFALIEVKSTDRWSGEMANNGYQASPIPRDTSGSSGERRQRPVQFNDNNQIVFALPEIHQQRNLTVGEFQNETARMATENNDMSKCPYC